MRLFGIRFKIHPFFWLLAALIGWLQTATLEGVIIWVAVVFVSVVTHELGHAFFAKLFGQKPEIQLIGFGGLTVREGEHLSLGREFLVVIAGPLFGLCLAAGASLIIKFVEPESTPVSYGLHVLVFANIFWSLFNLLPIHPLDGGWILSIVLEACFGWGGYRFSLGIGTFFSALLGLGIMMANEFFLGAIFMILAFENFRRWRVSLSMAPADRRVDLQKELEVAEKVLSNGEMQRAFSLFQEVKQKAKKGLIFQRASLFLGRIFYLQGELDQAWEQLLPVKDRLEPHDMGIVQKVLYAMGRWQEALEVGEASFNEHPENETARMNALSAAQQGLADRAISWLQYLVQEGEENLRELVKQADFDSVRNVPVWKQFEEGLH